MAGDAVYDRGKGGFGDRQVYERTRFTAWRRRE